MASAHASVARPAREDTPTRHKPFSRHFLAAAFTGRGSLLILLSVCVLNLLSNYIDVLCAYTQIEISETVELPVHVDGHAQHAVWHSHGAVLVRSFLSNKAALFIARFTAKVIATYAIARAQRGATLHFFREYLGLRGASFEALGASAIHHTITRRSAALVEFLTAILIDLLAHTLFLLVALGAIQRQIYASTGARVIGLLALYFGLSMVLRARRAALREQINRANERSSARCFDILSNYERVKAFDTTDMELERYYASLGSATRCKMLYEVTYVGLSLLTHVLLLCVAYCMLSGFARGTALAASVRMFVMSLSKVQESVGCVARDIDHILVSYSNLCLVNTQPSDFEAALQMHPDELGLDAAMIADPAGGNHHAAFTSGTASTALTARSDVSAMAPTVRTESTATAAAHAPALCSGPPAEAVSLTFKGTAYIRNNCPILHDISLAIPPGAKIAILGPNGSGKSTFLKLILGFLEYSGSLQLNGVEARRMPGAERCRLCAYLPQACNVFDKSLIDNLRDGNRKLTIEEIMAACRHWGLHETFKAIGYNRRVGERGCALSGGQRQKLCLARALLTGAPVLLLDQPCGAMDAHSAATATRHLLHGMPGTTVVNITDTLECLEEYDSVLFFSQGTIMAAGPFKTALAASPTFAKFYAEARQDISLEAHTVP